VVFCHWSEVGVTAPTVSAFRLEEEEDEDEDEDEVMAAADDEALGFSNVSVLRDEVAES
jgi:hypothetical protein